MTLRKTLLVLTLAGSAALIAPASQAVTFSQVQADKSSIGFGYAQMGVKMDGRFRRFTSQLAFDPAQPAKAQVTIDVDLASIDTGTSELDKEAGGKQWFDLPAFPTARFVSTGVTPQGNGRYLVAGKLTIKGRTQDITVPASFAAQGNTGTFSGSFTIRRGDFAIGEGPWAKFDIVANDVQVRFQITALGK